MGGLVARKLLEDAFRRLVLLRTEREIEVKAYDRKGRKMSMRARGFTARAIQHETDHLDGVLFFDRMRTFESLTFLDEYSRYWAKSND